jgi:uncharacterized lipoprotein
MRYFLKLLFFSIFFGLSLTACSHTPPDQTRFVQYAQTLPPIQTPPDVKNPTRESYYPVPPLAVYGPVGIKPPLNPPGAHLTPLKNVTLPAP